MSRFPYYHTGINFQIEDAQEEQLVSDILSMDYERIMIINEEIQLAFRLDYPEIHQRQHSVKVRAVALRVSQLKMSGQLKPRPSLADILIGGMAGWVLADAFDKTNH